MMSTSLCRVAEHGVLTAKAVEERKGRPSYRPIIDHDGLPRQRLSNEVNTKLSTNCYINETNITLGNFC